MCDYSIHAEKTRPAKVGDKLKTAFLGAGIGFCDVDSPETAVCLRPGTELAFPKEVVIAGQAATGYRAATFRKINEGRLFTHHDALEFPDGKIVLVWYLRLEQHAEVLQLPAEPKIENILVKTSAYEARFDGKERRALTG